MRGRSIEERIMSKVEKAESGCWIWTGAMTADGYGNFSYGSRLDGSRKTTTAHRAAYEALVGTVAKGMEVDHLCRVRNCVNPDHLEVVTKHENWRRGVSFTAQNAKKTQCSQGHPFDDENTRFDSRGWRQCRTCQMAWNANQNTKRRGSSLADAD